MKKEALTPIIIEYLHKEVFASSENIATHTQQSQGRVLECLNSPDFYQDSKGFWALKGRVRQQLNQS